MKCPKCGFVTDIKGFECPQCGIIYDKYKPPVKEPAKNEKENSNKKPALIPCPACENMVSTGAKSCPQCGHELNNKNDISNKTNEKKKKPSLIVIVGSFFLFLCFLAAIDGLMETSSVKTPPPRAPARHESPPPSNAQPEVHSPKLLLLDWSFRIEHGYAIVEGEVKNISSESLKNVEVVARFYSSSKQFITSDSALIEYNPIMPGQTSTFRAMKSYNPEMESASVDFKQLMGGAIRWEKQ